MNVWFWVFISYIFLNFLIAISMIFFERRKLTSIISWLTVLTFLPWIGFLLYIIFGSGLSIRVKKLIKNHKLYETEYDEQIKKYFSSEEDKKLDPAVPGIVKCCYYYGSILCPKNDIKIFTSGEDKLNALIADLENAKQSINIEYYIFADDKTGQRVMNTLIKKAKEGVNVRLIYDSIGCLGAPRRFFRKLKKAGGEVAEFFPPFAHIRMINLKMNYRNHKKIVVIDGKIAYTGGVNIRDDHMGKKKKLSPWRDTHIRMTGTCVYPLQNAFLNDWRYVKKENVEPHVYMEKGYFPEPETDGDAFVQVITSGPDSPLHNIEDAYIKLITNARKEILIQTPYFIPDEAFMTALRVAIASGVKVKIMVPYKPDHQTVFWVTQSYLKEFAELGAEIYFYDGFLHSKTLVVDDGILSIGTCNLDNRSFSLNFEDTVIIYSKEKNEEYKSYFEEDLKHCFMADVKYFKKKFFLTKFAQAIFRLFSPIL